MKTAVQPLSKEYSALDCHTAVNLPRNRQIDLSKDKGEEIHVVPGQTIQWWWNSNFCVIVTGVFGSISTTAAQQSDLSYWTPELLVTGPAGTSALCEYKRLDDPDDDPQPQPPPNVIIVDNSMRDGAKKRGSINVVRGH
jgi:hypothetical protein